MFRSPSETNKENRLITTVNRGTEGVGFEPTVAFRLRLISSQVPSTTQPPFHSLLINDLYQYQDLHPDRFEI